MSWGGNVARIVAALSTPGGGAGGVGGGIGGSSTGTGTSGGLVNITGSQHIDQSVNTNVSAGDNSFNEDASTNAGPGAVQVLSANTTTAGGDLSGALADDASTRLQDASDGLVALQGAKDSYGFPVAGPGSLAAAGPAADNGKLPTWAKYGAIGLGVLMSLGLVVALLMRRRKA